MQDLNSRLKPERFEDLIAVLALYRPGPMESGMLDDFIARKHGLKSIEYPFDVLKDILEPTYGVIVYQEQVMQIVQVIGGFSLGGADVVRRAMGKKDPEKMKKLKDEFANGAQKQGYDKTKAEDLWELIVKFAGYGFNKSHSAAYALIAFQTAYLKTYYPSEFMAALLTSEENNVDKIAEYIDEMNKMNIKLLPPSINKAIREFSAIKLEDGTDGIVYGLGAIKSVGIPAVENLLQARNGGEFKNINEFLSKINSNKINKKAIENLIKAGAFDEFGYTRKCLINNLENISDSSRKISELKKNASSSLFGEEELTNDININIIRSNEEFELLEKLEYEKEILGIYVSGHPLDKFSDEISKIDYVKSIDFPNLKNNGEILSIGKIEDFKSFMSKNNKRYGKINILDYYNCFDVMVFEQQCEEIEEIFKDQNKKNQVYGFFLSYKFNNDKISFSLKNILTLDELQNTEYKVKKEFKNKEKENYTQEPNVFEENVIELNLHKLNKDIIYEIYDIARNAHNMVKNNKKLVLKIMDVDTCLFYHTDFVINDEIFEKISKYND